MAAESHAEQIARVEQMLDDDGNTWDLSDNDQAALGAVLKDRAELLAALEAVQEAAQTDSDTCAICSQDLLRHASGCAILTVQAAIAKAEGRA